MEDKGELRLEISTAMLTKGSLGTSAGHASHCSPPDALRRSGGDDAKIVETGTETKVPGGRENAAEREAYRPHTKRLSLEYILCVCWLVVFLGNGFVVVSERCAAFRGSVASFVDRPNSFFASLGSVGYDKTNDMQVGSYVFHFKKFVLMYSVMGLVLWALRALSAGPAEAFSTLDSVPAQPQRGSRLATCCPRLAAFCRRNRWLPFLFIAFVGNVFIFFSHGPHTFFLVLIPAANYALFTRLVRCRRVSFRVYMTVMWTLHLALLYLNEAYSGYESVYWLQKAIPSSITMHYKVVGRAGNPLWRTRMRWFLAYRMYVLRMISFNYDMWEANRDSAAAKERAIAKHTYTCIDCAKLREQSRQHQQHQQQQQQQQQPAAAAVVEVCEEEGADSTATGAFSVEQKTPRNCGSDKPFDESLCCYKFRTEYPRPQHEYTYLNYVAYLLYSPVYLAGPITSFNAFVSHVYVPTKAMPPRAMALYAVRIAIIFGAQEFLLYFIYVKAISATVAVLAWFSIGAQAYFMYYYLAFLWLKFSFMWKMSRFFSLLSGVDVPENMRRCFTNTFSVRDFWRDWHASFNLWIVRYMYIPMGGRKRILFSIGPIFFFIAMWHDQALHLLKWAFCIVFMFALELLVSSTFTRIERAFNREMEKVWELEPSRAANLGSRGDGSAGDKEAPLGTERSTAQRLFKSLARFAALRLSPRQRYGCHRVIVILGGSTTVFALIVANLIGYHVQTDVRMVASKTESTIERGLERASWSFYLWLTAAMLMASYHGVMSREITARELAEDRARYGLWETVPPDERREPPQG